MPQPYILTIFITAFLIGFSGAMMPGSLLVYTISATARYGFWAGPLLVLGHGILELGLITALVLGLDRFIKGDLLSSIVGLIGGLVLIIMGLVMIHRWWRKSPVSFETPTDFTRSRKLIISGIILSISNPYWFIWWATIGMTYLLWSLDLGAIGVASFYTGHILADLSWYALVALIIAKGRKAINSTLYAWVLMICGVAIVGIGAYFIFSGVAFLID
ncbi:LysE family transporter [Chloroflexota bacterium]